MSNRVRGKLKKRASWQRSFRCCHGYEVATLIGPYREACDVMRSWPHRDFGVVEVRNSTTTALSVVTNDDNGLASSLNQKQEPRLTYIQHTHTHNLAYTVSKLHLVHVNAQNYVASFSKSCTPRCVYT